MLLPFLAVAVPDDRLDEQALNRIWGQSHAEGASFCVTGDVALVCGGTTPRIDLYCRDDFYPFWPTGECPVRGGDRVRLSGHFGPPSEKIRKERDAPLVPYADAISLIGEASPHHHDEISGGRLTCGDYTNAAVAVRGVLSGARRDELNPNWNLFVLRTPTGKVFVATPDREHSLASLQALTDGEVLVRGLSSFTGRLISFNFISFHLIPAGRDGLVCLTPPPNDPFDHPALPDAVLTKFENSCHREDKYHHRHLVSATLIGRSASRLFVRTDAGFHFTVSPDEMPAAARPGARLEAVGFIEKGPCGVELVEALVRLRPRQADVPDPGSTVSVRQLVPERQGTSAIDTEWHGEIVRLSGMVANARNSILHDGIVRLACDAQTIPVDIRAVLDDLPDVPEAGSEISVTGIPYGSFRVGTYANDLPVFTGFTIYPRTPEDVVIVAPPPWWTAGRLTGVILALLVLLVAILIWNRSLAVLSDRRGKRLYAEAIAHTKAEMKVEERTHLAVELHDALSQTLTGVALQIDSACLANRDGNTRVGQVLEVAKSMLASCRRELHNCLWDLRSRTFAEKDMTEAVTRTLAPYSDGVEISVRFNVPRSLFEEAQSHAILRMVREFAVNAIDHGHATRLWIAGEHHDGMVSFSVRDNGCGFDLGAAPGPRQGHFGLQGVRERLDKLSGNLEIRSEPGKGTKVSIRFRIQGEGHE